MRRQRDGALPPTGWPGVSRAGLLRGAAAGAAGLLVAGAVERAGAAAGYPAINPDLAGEKGTLDLWLSMDLAGEGAYHAAISAFQRAYPGLRVRLTPVVFAAHPTW